MSVQVLTSSSAGAPALSGLAGSLLAVLDFCLVTSSGWEKLHAIEQNKAVYRPTTGRRFYLAVDDTLTLYSTVAGYRTMSGPSTGTYRFPWAGTPYYVRKSSTADSVSRPWLCIVSDTAFYFFTDWARTGIYGDAADSTSECAMFFGDLAGTSPQDVTGAMLIAQEATVAASQTLGSLKNSITTSDANAAGHALAGTYTASTSLSASYASKAIECINILGNLTVCGQYGSDANFNLPDARTGAILLRKVHIVDKLRSGDPAASEFSIRGQLPGFYAPLHYLPASKMARWTDNGREFLWVTVQNGSLIGRAAIEITPTAW